MVANKQYIELKYISCHYYTLIYHFAYMFDEEMFDILLPEYIVCLVDCRTVSGPSPFARCVFPFKHDGNIYWGCPVDPDDSRKRWCSTMVDRNGHHISGRNEYGHCDVNCPIHTDRRRSDGVSSASKLSSNHIEANRPRVSKGEKIK